MPLLPNDLRRELKKIARLVRGWGGQRSQSWLTLDMQQRLAKRRKQSELESTPRWAHLGQRRQWLNMSDAYVTLARELSERQASRIGLEWRQPFWNVEIMRSAFSTPEHLRLRGNESKWLHRQALTGLLPEQVLQRQSKAEFSVVFSRHWNELRKELKTEVLPRRRAWVEPSGFIPRFDNAFDPEREEWITGIAWTLFGVDVVATQGSTNTNSLMQSN